MKSLSKLRKQIENEEIKRNDQVNDFVKAVEDKGFDLSFDEMDNLLLELMQ